MLANSPVFVSRIALMCGGVLRFSVVLVLFVMVWSQCRVLARLLQGVMYCYSGI